MDPPQNTDDIISTLPTENGWVSDVNQPIYYYKGFWFHRWIRGVIAAQSDSLPSIFELSPTTTVLACNPKCGTTWLKVLSFAIATRSCSISGKTPLQFTNPHHLVSYLEAPVPSNIKSLDPNNVPLVATHLPYTHLPPSVLALECRIVYIWRDPKDAFISHWHFARKMRPNHDVTEPIPLEEAFELFCRGASVFGPYWDHVLGYWKAFRAHPDKILFLKYEDMMGCIEEQVKRLVEFMGYPFSAKEEKEGVIARIVEMCSFESLSNLSVNKAGVYHKTQGPYLVTNNLFFRKAKVGDWKNYLTEEMANKIDQITTDKLGACGLKL